MLPYAPEVVKVVFRSVPMSSTSFGKSYQRFCAKTCVHILSIGRDDFEEERTHPSLHSRRRQNAWILHLRRHLQGWKQTWFINLHRNKEHPRRHTRRHTHTHKCTHTHIRTQTTWCRDAYSFLYQTLEKIPDDCKSAGILGNLIAEAGLPCRCPLKTNPKVSVKNAHAVLPKVHFSFFYKHVLFWAEPQIALFFCIFRLRDQQILTLLLKGS